MKDVKNHLIQAAKFVKVSYSTAKKVFTKFRQSLRESLKRKA
jgi:hypothetical protein